MVSDCCQRFHAYIARDPIGTSVTPLQTRFIRPHRRARQQLLKGEMQMGVTLRDLVHAIPYYAIQQGLLTVEKKGKKNIFSGRILEIEGLESLTVEQAFELSDASAERSAAGCTIKLGEDTIAEYLRSNIVLLRAMIAEATGTHARSSAAPETWRPGLRTASYCKRMRTRSMRQSLKSIWRKSMSRSSAPPMIPMTHACSQKYREIRSTRSLSAVA